MPHRHRLPIRCPPGRSDSAAGRDLGAAFARPFALRTGVPTTSISLRVLLFARFADLLGADEVQVTLPPGATVAEVIRAIRALPGGSQIPERTLVAVNFEQADADAIVHEGDEVALLPPVAGG